MTVAQLRKALRAVGLPISGTKIELVGRLERHRTAEPPPSSEPTYEESECAPAGPPANPNPVRFAMCRHALRERAGAVQSMLAGSRAPYLLSTMLLNA